MLLLLPVAPLAINAAAPVRSLGWPQPSSCHTEGFDNPIAAKLDDCFIKRHDNGTVTTWMKKAGALTLSAPRRECSSTRWHTHPMEMTPVCLGPQWYKHLP
jgi:hypothetical protein